MNDPLSDFIWDSLYQRYDSRCVGFDPQSTYLRRFDCKRPASDRELYYQLIDAYTPQSRISEVDPVGLYKSLLYWKLYSQHTTPSMFRKWSEGGGFTRASNVIPELYADLSPQLPRDVDAVISKVESLSRYKLPGMVSPATIPVRTTFLHFIYPNSVPVFDRMVLRAVGNCRTDANRSYAVLREFLPFAWRLADKYERSAGARFRESPLRLLDMALWVHRGLTNF